MWWQGCGRIGFGVWVPLLLAATLSMSCARAPRTLILLVVVDTLRADRIGSYGGDSVATPTLDSLATRGIRYDAAFSAAPVTLPSVTSILTGAYPPQHGIRDNGDFRLPAEWRTLAESLAPAGYASAAFVSADVLASRHGLDQGFAVYDDDFSAPFTAYDPQFRHLVADHQGLERRATQTIDAALAWVDESHHTRAFLFVHVFDPHVWRDPPPPHDARYPDAPYAGEIAYVDRELKRLVEGIAEYDRTLCIVTSDHGEGLQDPHAEELHGFLLHRETTRVPLIMTGHGVPAGVTVPSVVRTIDILPTVCDFASVAVPDACTGRRLPRTVEPVGSRIAYSETFRPRVSYGWCELRALRTDRWTLIEGPSLELYDSVSDPTERVDVAAAHPALRDHLAERLDSLAFGVVRHASLPAEPLDGVSGNLEARLRSLGYVSASDESAPGSLDGDSVRVYGFAAGERGRTLGLPNPKARLASYNRRLEAETLSRAGHAALSEDALERAIDYFSRSVAIDSSSADAYGGLALALERADRAAAAIEELRSAIRRFPKDIDLATALAYTEWRAGRHEDALATLRASPRVPAVLVAEALMHLDRGRAATSIPLLRSALRQSPEHVDAWRLLASAYETLGQPDSVRAIERLVDRLDPSVP